MRHRKAGRKLNRNSSHRKAMWSNMVASLITHGRIETTEAAPHEPHALRLGVALRVGGRYLRVLSVDRDDTTVGDGLLLTASVEPTPGAAGPPVRLKIEE